MALAHAELVELIQAGTSMVDVARSMGVPHEDVMRALTNGSPSAVWEWSEHDWLRAESVLYDQARSMSRRQLQATLGLSNDGVDNLCRVYGVQHGVDTNDRLASMREALLAGLHPKDAIAVVAADGYEATYDQLYMMRKRMADRGEVSREMPPLRALEHVA